jgi:cytochrome c oxidase assembly protein subunit 15
MTVLLGLPLVVSVTHACLAQAFLCLTVALAVTTAPHWHDAPLAAASTSRSPLATLATATAAAVYLQLVVGAIMRHSGAGLAIPDFPLAFGRLVPPLAEFGVRVHFLHRLGALAITILVSWSAACALAYHPGERILVRPALVAVGLVVAQVTLGAFTIWTGKAVWPTTMHVAVGAALLATTFTLALRARRAGSPRVRDARPWLAPEQVAT